MPRCYRIPYKNNDLVTGFWRNILFVRRYILSFLAAVSLAACSNPEGNVADENPESDSADDLRDRGSQANANDEPSSDEPAATGGSMDTVNDRVEVNADDRALYRRAIECTAVFVTAERALNLVADASPEDVARLRQQAGASQRHAARFTSIAQGIGHANGLADAVFTGALQESLARANEMMQTEGMQAGMSRLGSVGDDCLEDLRTDFLGR